MKPRDADVASCAAHAPIKTFHGYYGHANIHKRHLGRMNAASSGCVHAQVFHFWNAQYVTGL